MPAATWAQAALAVYSFAVPLAMARAADACAASSLSKVDSYVDSHPTDGKPLNTFTIEKVVVVGGGGGCPCCGVEKKEEEEKQKEQKRDA